MSEIIKIECPQCNEFVELGSMVGTYFGNCKKCRENGLNVRFSATVTINKIPEQE